MTTDRENPCWLNEALPAPVPTEYTPKGKWDLVGEMRTYIVGPSTAKKGLLVIYDIFGPSLQILQGADRLSEHTDALVMIPDLFKGNAPDHAEFEKDPTQGRAAIAEFAKTYADLEKGTATVLDLMPTFKQKFPIVDAWGIFGLCWGGKIAVLASIAQNSPFKASGQTHPGRLSADDARALTTPHICLPSKDEPVDVVDEYERVLGEKKLGRVERFPTMFHGWMGTRANLSDPENNAEYRRGYLIAAEFFAKNL